MRISPTLYERGGIMEHLLNELHNKYSKETIYMKNCVEKRVEPRCNTAQGRVCGGLAFVAILLSSRAAPRACERVVLHSGLLS
jgi:hypothetical protein